MTGVKPALACQSKYINFEMRNVLQAVNPMLFGRWHHHNHIFIFSFSSSILFNTSDSFSVCLEIARVTYHTEFDGGAPRVITGLCM
jgi:hypothetical protein